MLRPTIAAELPPAPAVERWVLEQPWPLAVALGALGVGIFMAMNRRGETRRGLAFGGAFAALGVAAVMLGTLFETTREHVAQLTDRLIDSVFAQDAEWAGHHLADGLVVASAGEIYDGFGKPELLATIRGFAAFRTEQWSRKLRGAALDGEGVARTRATIKVKARFTGSIELPSTWEFTWRRTGDERWVLVRLECLSIWGQPPTYNWERDARSIGRGGSTGGQGVLQRERI